MASELVKQVNARRNFNRDAVGMGTQIVLDNMRHLKQKSTRSNFAASTLGLAITGQNQRNQQWTNQKMKKVKEISQKATENAKQYRRDQAHYNTRLMAKHGAGYDIAGAFAKQKELVNNGYKLAIDGDWGKQSEAAWQDYQQKKALTKQDATDSNILYSLGTSKHPKVKLSDSVKGIAHTNNILTNEVYRNIISPAAETISPRYGIPAIGYFRGVIDSNNPLNAIIGGANWEDSMFGPRMRKRFETRIKNGQSTYEGTSREGSAANDDIDYALSNFIGGYTNHNREAGTDTYDWKNYGTLDDATTKFRKNSQYGPHGVVSGIKNIMEWAAPYIMFAEKGESKAVHQDTGKKVESFTDDELSKINRPWQSAPKIELKIKK